MADGKAYANRKPESERPEGDLYHTPKSLVWELLKHEYLQRVWEPACGHFAISDVMEDYGIECIKTDLIYGQNFLDFKGKFGGEIVTNPPFSIWDKFIMHAKKRDPMKLIAIGRTNYFGTAARSVSGIWDGLRTVYVFNRYVDYQTPLRHDGLFHVGSMCTGWFVWERGYTGNPEIEILDVTEYAQLGAFKKKEKK